MQAYELVTRILEELDEKELGAVRKDAHSRERYTRLFTERLGKDKFDLPQTFNENHAMQLIQDEVDLLEFGNANPDVASLDLRRGMFDRIVNLSKGFYFFYYK